jgi:hypothetical protein
MDDFLVAGFMVRDRLSAEAVSRWRAAFHAEIKRRGGVVGDHYVQAIAKEVLAEVAEQATRRFRNELVVKVSEYMSDEQIEDLESELSNILARTLTRIEDK